MKTVKSLLLGSAAGFAALTGAQAADLPMAEPVEYVKICSTYGEGFFYIPGTDTCLQISGKVRVEGYIHFNGSDTDSLIGGYADNDFTTKARGVLGLDARTETEWGTLRSYIELEANNDTGSVSGISHTDYDDGELAVEMVAGFIQFAGITAGYAGSFYDWKESNTYADFFSAEDVWTLAYTASFGSGFSATIGVEDKHYRANPYGGDAGGFLDQTWPNVVAALRVDQAWGSAQLSGAVQDNEGEREDYAVPIVVEDEFGFAVQAGAKFNLPIAEEGSYFMLAGAYSEGATSYAAGEEDFGDFIGDFGLPDQSLTAAGLENNELWVVGGSVGIQASETVALALTGAYYEFDDAAGDIGDFEGIFVEGNIVWTPVDNLDLGLYVLYGSAEGTGADDLGDPIDVDGDDLRIVTRIERNF